MSETQGDAKGPEANPPHGKKESGSDPRLRIVKPKETKKHADDLDLDLGEFEGDRRYGREDIADK